MTRRENGQIILGWLVKLLIGLTIFGVVAFEAGAVIAARVQVDGIAVDAAREAALLYGNRKSARDAEQIAREFAERSDARLVGFAVSGDKKRVTVTVEKRASTIFVHRIGGLKRYSVARSTHETRVV